MNLSWTFLTILAATTPDWQQAENMPGTIILEAPADHFDFWEKKIPCPVGIFNTDITVSGLEPTPQFGSRARIHFSVGDKETGLFSLSAAKPGASLIPYISRYLPDDTLAERHDVSGIYQVNKTISVRAYWNDTSITFSVNGKQQPTIKLTRPIESFKLFVVGSRVRFEHNSIQCNLTS